MEACVLLMISYKQTLQVLCIRVVILLRLEIDNNIVRVAVVYF